MRHYATRRAFLQRVAGAALATPFLGAFPRPSLAARGFDPDFGTASEAVRALRQGVISPSELLEHVYRRVGKHNPRINAFITLNEEQARRRAKEADEALAAGRPWGRLHGLPIVIKDSFATAGLRTTSGSKTLETYIPERDAVAVERLRAAGAIIVGKTNLPEFASDLQSYNEVAGTTNNPWDVSRTPGGSTGGGAAALAAGFGFLELGSDIGGSIRTPCHFCGIYGHKPTLNVVPLEGHIPPPPGQVQPITDLPVAGPMARSAQDLRLELEVLGDPTAGQRLAYQWKLPAPRGTRPKDYRIGYVLDDPLCSVPPEVRDPLAETIEALTKAGAQLVEGWPPGVNPQDMLDNYFRLLAAFFSVTTTEEELQLMRDSFNSRWGYYARIWHEGTTMSHKAWLAQTAGRRKARDIWQEYFETHDAFLMPVNFVPAFPHDHNLTFFERTVQTSQGARLYGDMLRWISFATLTGCPATVAPVGRTKGGQPVGIQILGPFLEDATPIDIAGGLADLVGGFEPPPGYEM